MAKKGKKRKSRRSGGKKVGHKRDKRFPLLLTGGALITGYKVLGAPVVALAKKQTTFGNAATVWVPANAMNYTNYMPLVAGLAGSVIASKVGVNKYMRKLPIVGKMVKL